MNISDSIKLIKEHFSKLYSFIPIPFLLVRTMAWFYLIRYNSRTLRGMDYNIPRYSYFFNVEKGDAVIDIGAGIGSFALSVINKARLIIAIEPSPHNVSVLRKNTQKFQNIIIIEKAISNAKGKLRLYRTLSPIAHSVYMKSTNRTKIGHYDVEADTLDNIVANYHLKQIDFLKINVEGAEIEVLKGGKNALMRTKKVVVSANHLRDNKLTYLYVEEFLKELGFIVKIAPQNTVYGMRARAQE